MAYVTLGSKPLMSIVKIKENNVAQEFYVVRHNAYTNGRTLLLRRYTHSDRQWHTSMVNAYASCTLDAWFNGEYLNSLPIDIRGQIAAVTIPYIPGDSNWGLSNLSRKVFSVSATELGQSHPDMTVEGTALANAATLKIATDNSGTAKVQWTRSPITCNFDAWSLSTVGNLQDSVCSSTCSARPALTLPSSLNIDDNGNVTVNQPPTMPPSVAVPDPVHGGSSLSLSWGTSTDPDGNLLGYKLERSVNSGAWAQIYEGAAASFTDNITYGWLTVQYRVRAYDSAGAVSDYVTSPVRTVINNSAPASPPSISVPDIVRGGKACAISWAAATDVDGNLSGYRLERSVDSGGWTSLYEGINCGFTDQITRGWTTVCYRVRAYDAENAASGFCTSAVRTVVNNLAPNISGTDADLGLQTAAFTQIYSVSDDDSDPITVTEALDGGILRTLSAVGGAENTVTIDSDRFQKLLNGVHTVAITAADQQGGQTVRQWTFTKSVTKLSVTLTTPLAADAMPTKCIVNLTGIIAPGALLTVEVCNNGNDTVPTWEDCTVQAQNGRKHFFTNTTKTTAKWGFNARVKVDRAGAVGDCFISAIGGNFE